MNRVFSIFFCTALALLIATNAMGQMKPLKLITYDSLVADSLNTFGLDNPEYAKGKPDHTDVVISTTGDWLFVKFYHGAQSQVEFQPGATIEFYWDRPFNDTSHAYFILRHYLENWDNPDGAGDTAFVAELGRGAGMYSMTVVGTGYNTVEVWRDYSSRTGLPIYIDAIVLKQHGTLDSVGQMPSGVDEPLAYSSGFLCYPNPFPARAGTTVHSMTGDSHGTYIVMDLLGREVHRVSSSDDLHFTLDAPGTYFVRQRLEDGTWSAPVRISAQ